MAERIDCEEVERRLAPYIDQEALAAERAEVTEHLDACPPCRRRAAAMAAARELLHARRQRLTSAVAPPALRARCAGLARARRQQVPVARRLAARMAPLAMAAVLVLAVGAGLLVATKFSATVLAAQLAADHLKCFAMFTPTGSLPDVHQVETQLANYGCRARIPPSSRTERVSLLGARRCLYADGHLAHVLYRHDGRPVSLYVIPEGPSRAAPLLAAFGHQASIWRIGTTTYVLIGSRSEPDFAGLASYARRATE